MYISLSSVILAIILFAFIRGVLEPAGRKWEKWLDSRAASKAARRAARGPGWAILGGIALIGAVIGGSWLLWGSTGAIWAAWFIAGPFIVTPAMLALRRWFLCGYQ